MTPEEQARAQCPFCGGNAAADEFTGCPTEQEWRFICENKTCQAWGPERQTREEALAAWNSRSALSREEQVRAEERAAIVAWLRETADEIDARADQSSNEAQRSNLSGLAFGERFRAKQIENGRHHMTRDEYRERFFSSLRASGHEGGDGR